MSSLARVVAPSILWLVAAVALFPGAAWAQPAPAEAPLAQRIAVWRFDALGIEAELVSRLEALFRSEIGRLASRPLPTRQQTERKITGELAQCTGEERCLAAIGKRLEVDVVVSGSVGALGDNYLLDIKVVDVASAKLLRRITTEPLRGTPDELIDSVRVAAYRLLAPHEVHGSITVLSDLIGGEVYVDGARVGTTPLAAPIDRLAPGPHVVRVAARGYAPFEEKVEVRFQKTARVEVRLVVDPSGPVAPAPVAPRRATPWYQRGWALAAIGVGAVVAGAVIGYELGYVDRQCVNCSSGLVLRAW